MKKAILVFLVISGMFLYPFGCEGQVRVNGNLDNNGRFTMEEALQKTVDSLNTVLVDYKTEVSNLEKTVADGEVKLTIKQNELDAAVSTSNLLTANIVTLNNEISAEKSKNSTLTQRIEDLENQIEVIESQLAIKDTEIAQLNKDVATIDGFNADLMDSLEVKQLKINNLEVALAEKPTTVTDTVYLDKIVVEVPPVKIDTITTISDPILLDFTDSLVQPKDSADIYVMVIGIGMVHLQELDTIYRFQTIYDIERTVDYSESRDQPTTYRNIGLPFQFRDAYETEKTSTRTRINISATEPFAKIEISKNGIRYKTFETPELSYDKISEIQYDAYFFVDYEAGDKIQIFITSPKGHVDLRDMKL